MNFFNPLPHDFTLDNLTCNMLLKSNIIDFNHSNSNTQCLNDKPTEKPSSESQTKSLSKIDKKTNPDRDKRNRDMFYPKEKDTLFWCYYIYKNGIDHYIENKKRAFTIEKETKITTVDKIQKPSIKDSLKANKIKKTAVEDELINRNAITITSLRLFMLLDKSNAIVIRKNCYLEIQFNNDLDIMDATNTLVFLYNAGEYSIYRDLESEKLREIIAKRYRVADFDKPLKSVASYRVDELHAIAETVNIALLNPDTGRNKTKQMLYNAILERLLE